MGMDADAYLFWGYDLGGYVDDYESRIPHDDEGEDLLEGWEDKYLASLGLTNPLYGRDRSFDVHEWLAVPENRKAYDTYNAAKDAAMKAFTNECNFANYGSLDGYGESNTFVYLEEGLFNGDWSGCSPVDVALMAEIEANRETNKARLDDFCTKLGINIEGLEPGWRLTAQWA